MITNITLTDEQELFIQKALDGHNILVDACVGSGKTTAIQCLCNRYADDIKVLYLTYNTLLKVDARNRIQNSHTTVTNYHGFAYSCLKDMGILVSVRDLITTFINKKPYVDTYNVIILDEYQDIDSEIAEMLNYIISTNPCIQKIVVGDIRQKVYDKSALDINSYIKDFLGEHINLVFTKCFRLPKEYAAKLGRIWGKEIVGVNDNCTITEMTKDEVTLFLAEKDPCDILCLGSRRFGNMPKVLNMLEQRYKDKFNKNTVFASIKDQDSVNVLPRESSAIFTTFDSCKGLERDICVIFDYTEKYWEQRSANVLQKYEILRNIFLVAASRGKSKIIFVHDELPLVSEKTLSTSWISKADFKDEMFNMSDMFDYKHIEDIESCFNLLKKEKVAQQDTTTIEIRRNDGMIDLSPCIGILLEATYFINYNIDREFDLIRRIHPKWGVDKNRYETLEEKILYLVALQTGHQRYMTQVSLPLVTEEQEQSIKNRLQSQLSCDEKEQIECNISFSNKKGGEIVFRAFGIADVIKDNTVYELKFVSELSHEHFLQCACYMVALNIEKGILWNVRTNEIWEISIPDRNKFLDAVARAITQGLITKYYKPQQTNLSRSELERLRLLKAEFQKNHKSVGIDYKVGDRVRHIKYGDGTVTQEPQDYKVTVEFDTAGQKIMYSSFAKLKKILHQNDIFAPDSLTESRIELKATDRNAEYISVIDTEITWQRDLMSVGIIIADAEDYKAVDYRYYIIQENQHEPAMFADKIHIKGIKEQIISATKIQETVACFLREYDIYSIYAYNASFDKKVLPFLTKFEWHDIEKAAAYRQYNPKLPTDAEYWGTGLLKHNRGVADIIKYLENSNYEETHNAALDARDELKILEILSRYCSTIPFITLL